ncbi:nicotinamidase-related amidase [Stackebrandtia albiflava]|uniref:Nicotinamidase-related amidase n=1 Tax=Stackebrandtia albiflava TaxID=406432 RepID=A0A562V560_9ACTN|nr:isochorismatase family protein [Stackebrandtia albiflava]TWJ12958.1 nicotinamidase-related amidase [Stackebrandtia albiflava]
MNSALLVIDVQESFRQRESWRAASDPDVAHVVARLVDHHRSRGDLVVWVTHSEPGTGNVFDPVRGHNTYQPPLRPVAGEPELVKTSHNAFTTTDLQRILTVHGITDVTVCGIRTEQCVETTARLASDLGYRVTVAVDATATEPLGHPDGRDRPFAEILADPSTLTTADIIERTRYVLAHRFARVATVAELIAEG